MNFAHIFLTTPLWYCIDCDSFAFAIEELDVSYLFHTISQYFNILNEKKNLRCFAYICQVTMYSTMYLNQHVKEIKSHTQKNRYRKCATIVV